MEVVDVVVVSVDFRNKKNLIKFLKYHAGHSNFVRVWLNKNVVQKKKKINLFHHCSSTYLQ